MAGWTVPVVHVTGSPQYSPKYFVNMFSTCCGTWDVGRGTAPRNTCDHPGFIGPVLFVVAGFLASKRAGQSAKRAGHSAKRAGHSARRAGPMGLSVSQLVHTPAHLTQNQVILCRKKASACHILLGLELTRVRGDLLSAVESTGKCLVFFRSCGVPDLR